jgi:hypothetical protein
VALALLAGSAWPAYGQAPAIDGNRIYLIGSWRITYQAGDGDDYWLMVQTSSAGLRPIWIDTDFEQRAHDFVDEDPSGWFIDMVADNGPCDDPSYTCPPVWLSSERINDNFFIIRADQDPDINDLELRFERLDAPAALSHDAQVRRLIQEALRKARSDQPDATLADVAIAAFGILRGKRESGDASIALRDAEYFMWGYAGALNRDPLTFVCVVVNGPIYYALKTLLFAVGSQEQVRTVLDTLNLLGTGPLSPPGGTMWAIRGLVAGSAPGFVGPRDAIQPEVAPGTLLMYNVQFPAGPGELGTSTPIYVDPPFGTLTKWELDESVAADFNTVSVAPDGLPAGVSLSLIVNGLELPLAAGQTLDLAADAGVSGARRFVIRAVGVDRDPSVRYALGLTFTQADPMVWITQTLLPVPGDFTGDLKSDIVWRHAALGEVWLWPIDGPARVSETFVRTVADTDFEIRGVRDQTGDGNADILWRNKVNGQMYFWPMVGSTPLAETYVATVDPAYDIVGTGDFDGDGKSDILWRNLVNGEVWIWLMDGATPLSQVYVDSVDPGYVIKGVGDVDGDGKADIVWHGVAGDVWVWLMSGTTRVSQNYVGTVPDTHYQIQQVADFTGDWKADILWWNTAQGDVWIWPMNGAAVLSESYVGVVPDTDYRIVGAGDYNGDMKADIPWHHATRGEVWVWLMDGTTTLSENYVGIVPDVGYQIVKGK